MSIARLQEIHNKEVEENTAAQETPGAVVSHAAITIQNLDFQYAGPGSPMVLKNICLTIPRGKVTAIVGTSGSGKTTLLKLLLGYYKPVSGTI